MSRKGSCWNNAPTESFWGRLKAACIHEYRFTSKEQPRRAIMDWMAFYNHLRFGLSQFDAVRGTLVRGTA